MCAASEKARLISSDVETLRLHYAYDMTMARSVAVSTAAIEQALKVIYPAPELLAELHAK